MTERQPVPRREPVAMPAAWDATAIGEVLGVPAEPRVDGLHGAGVRFRFDQSPSVEVELFPAAQVVRVTGEDIQLSLFRQEPPRLASDGVIFASTHHPDCWLAITATGATTLRLAPAAQVTEPPSTPPSPTEQRTTPDARPAPVLDDPVTPEGGIRPGLPETGEDQGRVRFGGRLGTDVRFRETKRGVLVAAFPVAVITDDGATRWEQVIAFNERAAQLRAADGPSKGRYVEVIGYRHIRHQKGRDGRVRRVEEVYAVHTSPEEGVRIAGASVAATLTPVVDSRAQSR